MSTNVEFALKYNIEENHESLEDVLKKSLSKIKEIDSIQMHANLGTIVVKSSLPVTVLHEIIESVGVKAVVKGYGGSNKDSLQAAVAIVGGDCSYGSGKQKGVVRFIQSDENTCIIDGTIDGLSPGFHGLHIHELGDLSNGCNNLGNHFSKSEAVHGGPQNNHSDRHTGDLGNIRADSEGRATFRFSDSALKVWDIIGRSVSVTEKEDDLGKGNNNQSRKDGNSGPSLACGIIARSAGLFENTKKICACSGISLWDERDIEKRKP